MSRRRNDFSRATKRMLADRVGHVCSCPNCRAPTSGPQLIPGKSVVAGDAAHITAASPKGPRYNHSLTPDERRHYNNGIWLCVNHARIVDQDKSRYTEGVLRRWKADAEAEAQKRFGRPQVSAEGIPSGHPELQPGDRELVQDCLLRSRKLSDQCRVLITRQVIHVRKITDLAAWREVVPFVVEM